MKKKTYLKTEVEVLLLQYESPIAGSPTPAPKVVCDFDEDDTAGEDGQEPLY